MTHQSCGLDFGTSNSTLGVWQNHAPQLIALEDGRSTIPSALFFDSEEPITRFGRDAISSYVDGDEGRLMRSLKSVLGSNLMSETTIIRRQQWSFQHILGHFIQHMKQQAEKAVGHKLTHVVLGRPVFFVDGDAQKDALAQRTLEVIAKEQGFSEVVFQYEPVAAALDYEQQVSEEKVALIVDIGGGTSDFSVIRVSPDGAKKDDRRNDVLSNDGVHIGGTDFDRLLSLKGMMPHLGYRTKMWDSFRTKTLDIPTSLFHDLATWHKINFLYTGQALRTAKDFESRSHSPELLERLVNVLELRTGHSLAISAENAKIGLAEANTVALDMSAAEKDLCPTFSRQDFNEAILDQIRKLETTMQETLKQAGVQPAAVDTVFLTGGSTAIPIVRDSLLRLVPQAEVVEGDRFGSVGIGLTLDAQRKFG